VGAGLAIALVVAGGAATLVSAVGSLRSLEETRTAYYERYQFADIFAPVRRAPKSLVNRNAEIPGVAAVEARITKLALLDIPRFREPATGQFISLPEDGQPAINRLYMRMGRMPHPGRPDEVVVSEGFAKAHAFALGAHFSAILNGRKRALVIVGAALSPEFIYAVGPGDRMPDERRFAIVWMSEKALASAYDLDGAFSWVNVKLLRDASEPEVIKRLDALIDPYGGQAAYGRRDQFSDAYIEHGLGMLRNMSRTLPPIFLLVAAFLINLTLGRIVDALEREQIGLLKALGSRSRTIAWHYVKFVALITIIGAVIGSAAGTWLGTYLTRLYGNFYRFPFRVFIESPDLHVVAALLSLLAAIAGALRALTDVVTLPPVVAMQPPAPPRFPRLLPATFAIHKPAVPTNPDDAAQYYGASDPGHVDDAGHGARDGDTRRLPFPDRDHGGPDQRHVFHGRSTGCDHQLCQKATFDCGKGNRAAASGACRRALSGGPGPHPARHDQRPAAQRRP
jgi:putative ABC transport system permease protein